MSHGIDLDLASIEQWARQKESIGDFLIFTRWSTCSFSDGA
jgi:hypothetical protein